MQDAEQQARLAQRRQTEEWFTDANTWVALFENKDRSSPNFGARIGLPFDLDEMPVVEVTVGKTRAPNLHKMPNTAKFVLIAICCDADQVVTEMFRQDPVNEDKPRFN